MTSVVLVHGIGVRGGRYLELFELFSTSLARIRPEVAVRPCQWGDDLGATLRDGLSVPGYEASRNAERAAEADWGVARWRLLAADPLHELRMLTVAGGDRAGVALPFEGGPRGTELLERVRRLPVDPEIERLLRDWRVADAFQAAVTAIASAPVAHEAAAAVDVSDAAPALSRAVIARTVVASEVVPLIAERRERLHELLVDRLGGGDLGGPLAAMGRSAAMLAWRWIGAGVVERRRGAIHDGANPFAGDVVHYLARGGRIREFIRACVEAAPPPVVVVAHSLGGVAAVDLLATTDLPGVAHLVTVGSQAPFLYEVDALPSLPHGRPLPPSVPRWTNVYDRRDLLAHVGADVFPGRVVDVETPSGNPFPDAHSDYFGNDAFYRVLADVVDEAAG